MRVVYVMEEGTPSNHTGGSLYNAGLMSYLREQSYEVLHIVGSESPFRSRRGFMLRNLWLLTRILRIRTPGKPSILLEDISSLKMNWLFNLVLKLSRNFRIVMMAHGVYHLHPEAYPFVQSRIMKSLVAVLEFLQVNLADAIVVPSEHTKEEIESLLIGSPQILVAHPGIDFPTAVNYPPKGASGSNDGTVNLLYVAHLKPNKDHLTLLEAFRILVNDRGIADLRLTLLPDTVHDEAYSDKLKQYISRNSLEDVVGFHPYVPHDDLIRFYQNAHIFVSPSLHESFGMAILEAMSFGLPIVAAKTGATGLLVNDKENGLLVAPGRPEALASAIETLAANPDLRKRMGQASREKSSKYSWATTFSTIMSLLEEVSAK